MSLASPHIPEPAKSVVGRAAVPQSPPAWQSPPAAAPSTTSATTDVRPTRLAGTWVDRPWYVRDALAVVIAVVGCALTKLLIPWVGEHAPFSPFVAMVMLSAYLLGPGPALVTTIVGAAMADAMFLTPRTLFVHNTPEQNLRLALFVGIGTLMSWISRRWHRAHRDLADREQKLRILLDRMPVVLWSTDAVLRLTGSSSAAVRHLFAKAAEVLPAGTMPADPDAFFQADAPDFLPVAAQRSAVTGESVSYDLACGPRYFHVSLEPLRAFDGSVTGTFGMAWDVTEQHRAEQLTRQYQEELEARVAQRTDELAKANVVLMQQVAERRRSQQELREVALHTRCVLWYADVRGLPGWRTAANPDERPGKVRWDGRLCDESVARAVLPIREPEGVDYWTAWAAARHPEDDRRMARVARRHLAQGSRYFRQEYRCTDRDGQERWLAEEVHVEPRGATPDGVEHWRCFGVVTDITHLKRVELELRSVTRNARCLFWHADVEHAEGFDREPPGGAPLKWDVRVADEEAAQEVLPLDVPAGRTYFNVWAAARHPDDAVEMNRTSDAAILGGQHGYSQEFRCTDRDGRERWMLETVSIHPRGTGRWYLVGVVTDVTARKAAEAQREQLLIERGARAELEAAHRAKDQFLAALSHELRTPLSPVMMTVSQLQDDRRLPEDVQSALRMVRRNVELEARLIDDLLDLTRINRGKLPLDPRDADAHSLLCHARDVAAADAAAKQVRVQLECHAERSYVRADPIRLQQVFWNLLRNAVKFTPNGGSVTARTRNDEQGRLVVEVTDTGIGIEPHVLPRVFDAFEQGGSATTRQFGGLGLGLAISKAIVELHGGAIAASSPGRGQGATFTVTLSTIDAPVVQETSGVTPCSSGPAHSAAPAHEHQHPLRILLVEDHADTRKATARLLRLMGHDVATADSVAAALDACDARRDDGTTAAAAPFDLLISDIGLPDGSGLDLVRQLKRQHRFRAIALSGFGMESDLHNSRQAGFDLHLTKPVPVDQLEAAIREITAPGAALDAAPR